MLLFILHTIKQEYQSQYFNTSHVTVYQVEIAGKKYTWTHFNTSHVTVYQSFRTIMIRLRRHFNTSHVTVYHLTVDFNDSDIILFQYISCYCLSIRRTDFIAGGYISIHLMLLFITVAGKIIEPKIWFQYISCYCLSVSKSCSISSVLISIHLMLLFIIHRRLIPQILCSISIHLMLLFINKSECIICRNKRFQYISCYCLSPSEHPIFLPVFISIHLMLLFIGELVLLCSC